MAVKRWEVVSGEEAAEMYLEWLREGKVSFLDASLFTAEVGAGPQTDYFLVCLHPNHKNYMVAYDENDEVISIGLLMHR